jgi:hypothetical protein
MSAVGDELVVTHTKNRMILQGRPIATDVVIAWRIVDGRIVEVWYIPSVYTATTRHKGDAKLRGRLRVFCDGVLAPHLPAGMSLTGHGPTRAFRVS